MKEDNGLCDYWSEKFNIDCFEDLLVSFNMSFGLNHCWLINIVFLTLA